MDSVLIVSNTNTTLGIISDLLNSQPFSRIVIAQNCAEARRDLISDQFDLIIIDTSLPDEYGDDFSLYAAEETDSGIILIVENDKVYDVSADVEEAGIFVLPKPVSPEFFYQAVKLLIASRKRVKVLENENVKLQKKKIDLLGILFFLFNYFAHNLMAFSTKKKTKKIKWKTDINCKFIHAYHVFWFYVQVRVLKNIFYQPRASGDEYN